MDVSASKNHANNRVEWIDTAKGICILLVVLHHCSQMMHEPYLFSRDVLTFRMPLYFILSGLFFKYYSPKVFFVKKTNKLLAPYVFFLYGDRSINSCDSLSSFQLFNESLRLLWIGGDFLNVFREGNSKSFNLVLVLPF